MAKNNIAKALRPLVESTTCKIYAVFCIALVEEYGFTPEEAEKVCELSQALWNLSNEKNIDIFKWCEDVTGLDMKVRTHEQSKCDSCKYKDSEECKECEDFKKWSRKEKR